MGDRSGTELDLVGHKRENSVNESEDGSPEPGTPSPNHTPPLTPALTPQRVDTPAPENLSLRKPGSSSPQRSQSQAMMQAVDLVQPRHISPPPPSAPSLAVSRIFFFFRFKKFFHLIRLSLFLGPFPVIVGRFRPEAC